MLNFRSSWPLVSMLAFWTGLFRRVGQVCFQNDPKVAGEEQLQRMRENHISGGRKSRQMHNKTITRSLLRGTAPHGLFVQWTLALGDFRTSTNTACYLEDKLKRWHCLTDDRCSSRKVIKMATSTSGEAYIHTDRATYASTAAGEKNCRLPQILNARKCTKNSLASYNNAFSIDSWPHWLYINMGMETSKLMWL